jgi:hypothetical protein
MLDKGMVPVLGKTSSRFYHTTQNGAQLKSYEFLISGFSQIIHASLS